MNAGVYLLLKHLCLAFGARHSRLRPKLYTWIFVACDIVSILLQGAGGALSAVATTKSLLDDGVNIMIAGLAFQVTTLVIFACLAGDYFITIRRHRHDWSPSSLALAGDSRFRMFLIAALVAFICIFTRCCYRVAELSGGWGNSIMRKESEFIVLDSVYVYIQEQLDDRDCYDTLLTIHSQYDHCRLDRAERLPSWALLREDQRRSSW